MTRTVNLHIGHGKTGSSYIQSFLAINSDALAEQGVRYPGNDQVELARRKKITSGNFNAAGIAARLESFEKDFPAGDALLFSSEMLFFDLQKNPAFLTDLVARGYAPRVLLFTRNPLDHLRSRYVQWVKRHGYAGTIDQLCEEMSYSHPMLSQVGDVYRQCRDAGVEISVRSYDRHKKDVIAPLIDFLGVRRAGMVEVAGVVNRSLSDAEIYLQRRLNAALPNGAASFVADALCENAPDVRASRLLPGDEALQRFVGNVNAEMAALNALFDAACEPYEAISAPPGDETPSPDGAAGPTVELTFTRRQIDVLAESVGAKLGAPARRGPATGFLRTVRDRLRPRR